MWFSSNRPERPRRHPSHATVVAYVALLVAVLGIPATAVAAGALVHTRNIADGAVTAPKIRDGAVTNPKIRNGAVTGAKVATNSLGGGQINERRLRVTRIARRMRSTHAVAAPPSGLIADIPLVNNTYTQRARTTDVYQGMMRVRFPAGCTAEDHSRQVYLTIFNNGVNIGEAVVEDAGSGTVTAQQGFTLTPVGAFTTEEQQRNLTAEAYSYCDEPTQSFPVVQSVRIEVVRFFR